MSKLQGSRYPKVTIMIPAYNQEEYIGEAIESALSQDYPNLEILISDDCSKDGTPSVIKNYSNDSRVKVVINDHNLGRAANYHKTAHDVASGDWLINLDGDDFFISRDFISNAIKEIKKCPSPNVVAYCYAHPVHQLKKWLPYTNISEDAILINGRDYFINYYSIGSFGHPNILYKREIGLRIGMYTLPYQASDFHTLMRIFLNGNVILDRRKVSYWRIHGKNTTILEVDDKWRQAQLTFDSLQQFAVPYFDREELRAWRQNMDKVAFKDYIRTRIRCRKDLKSLWLLISRPEFSHQYAKDWYDFIFH